MKHFIKPDGSVFGFESDGSQDALITPDMTLMTQDDLDARAAKMAAAPPPVITMRQARLALWQAGLLAAVQQGVAVMPMDAQINWEFASTVERDSPLVTTLAAALKLTPADLDTLFTLGATL